MFEIANTTIGIHKWSAYAGVRDYITTVGSTKMRVCKWYRVQRTSERGKINPLRLNDLECEVNYEPVRPGVPPDNGTSWSNLGGVYALGDDAQGKMDDRHVFWGEQLAQSNVIRDKRGQSSKNSTCLRDAVDILSTGDQ